MTWKVYAILSGGAFLATYLVSFSPGLESPSPGAGPAPASVATAGVDIVEQADRLQVRDRETTAYRDPVRNVFRFGANSRRTSAPPIPAIAETPAPVVEPPRPPFSLAGIATDTVDGAAVHTAILSSLRGVLLVREGEVIDGGYRVVAIDDGAVTLEATADGSRTTVRISP